jgi:hypothetical protein
MPYSLCYRNRSEFRSHDTLGMACNPTCIYLRRTLRLVFLHHRGSIRAAIALKSQEETPIARRLYYA